MENFQLCSKLEALLLRKKLLNNGDSPEIHAQKVWILFEYISDYMSLRV